MRAIDPFNVGLWRNEKADAGKPPATDSGTIHDVPSE